MEKRADRKRSTKKSKKSKKSKAGHVAIIRDHLAEQLVSRARYLYKEPWNWLQVMDFLEDLPELLRRFRNIGQEEAEELGYKIPICFKVRILRISEVVTKVHASMMIRGTAEWNERIGNEVAPILANMGCHVDRIIIDRNEDRPYHRIRDLDTHCGELFVSPVVSVIDGHIPLLRLNGAVGSWNRMNSLIDDCDCLLCSSQIADMIS
jgi:hypothetical protein